MSADEKSIKGVLSGKFDSAIVDNMLIWEMFDPQYQYMIMNQNGLNALDLFNEQLRIVGVNLMVEHYSKTDLRIKRRSN